jgi:hypothetical protein
MTAAGPPSGRRRRTGRRAVSTSRESRCAEHRRLAGTIKDQPKLPVPSAAAACINDQVERLAWHVAALGVQQPVRPVMRRCQ